MSLEPRHIIYIASKYCYRPEKLAPKFVSSQKLLIETEKISAEVLVVKMVKVHGNGKKTNSHKTQR